MTTQKLLRSALFAAPAAALIAAAVELREKRLLAEQTVFHETKRIPDAIRYFLPGLAPKAKIVITKDRPSARS